MKENLIYHSKSILFEKIFKKYLPKISPFDLLELSFVLPDCVMSHQITMPVRPITDEINIKIELVIDKNISIV